MLKLVFGHAEAIGLFVERMLRDWLESPTAGSPREMFQMLNCAL
jgi:hypothetical protein